MRIVPYIFMATSDEANAIAHGIQRVEHRQITFAGHAKSKLGSMREQLIDDELPARARRVAGAGGHGTHLNVARRQSYRERALCYRLLMASLRASASPASSTCPTVRCAALMT